MILFLAAVCFFLLRADRRKFEVVVSTFLSSLQRHLQTPRMRECSRTAGIPKNVLVKRLRGNALRVTRKIAPLANQTLFGPTPRAPRDSSPDSKTDISPPFPSPKSFHFSITTFLVRLELFLHARIYYFLRCWLTYSTLTS